jgi:hypothetical protein
MLGQHMKRFLASILAVSALLPSVAAAEFNPGLVLSDSDLSDTSVPDDYAQKFLESKNSGIARMTFQDIDGSMKKPGDLITYYAKTQGVNPRFILALIQKEQSLVTDGNPSTCQVEWAAGYGRPDGSTCNDPAWQKHRGFTNQVVSAAAFIQHFFDTEKRGERRTFGYNPGAVAIIDGTPVIPQNLATALLYTYTPHLHGNRLLVDVWSKWFASNYPDGSYLQAPDGKVFLVQAGLKRSFATRSAWRSRVDESRLIQVGYESLASFPDGPGIKFADYSLVRLPKGSIYLLVKDVKRPIESMKVFRSIGFNPEEIDEVEPSDLESYREGSMITLKSSYPTGALLQDKKSGGVYFVENGVKYPIFSAEIMKTNFPGKKISAVSKTVLEALPSGDPVKFREGELITSAGTGNTVFVISNGARRPIPSAEVFEKLGYRWDRIIPTTVQAVEIHPLGSALSAN